MSSSSYALRSVALVLLVSLSTACAGFQGKDALPLVDRAALASSPTAPARVYSKWSLQTSNALYTDEIKIAAASIQKDRIDKAIVATGCCTIVESRAEADVVLEGLAHDENNPAALLGAVITGASLYTIPSWIQINMHLSAKATAGSAEHAYDVRDSMLMVQWLPLIVVAPFKNPLQMEARLVENVINTLIQGLQRDGLLQTRAATPATAGQ